jgi:hypothetical protein
VAGSFNVAAHPENRQDAVDIVLLKPVSPVQLSELTVRLVPLSQ